MKYLKILLIYVFLIILNFFGVDYYIGKSGFSGGEVGMLNYLILIVISITSIVSLIFTYVLNFKFKIDILKSIIIHQIIYLLVFIIFGGLNPFDSEIDFWTVLISFISQFLIIISFLSVKLIFIKNDKST